MKCPSGHGCGRPHKLGDAFGTPVLTVSITIIPVGLIVMLMLTGPDKAALPRDTLFSQS